MIWLILTVLGCAEREVCFGDCEPRPWAHGTYWGVVDAKIQYQDWGWVDCEGIEDQSWLYLRIDGVFAGEAQCSYWVYNRYAEKWYPYEISGPITGTVEGTELVQATWEAAWTNSWGDYYEADLDLAGEARDRAFNASFYQYNDGQQDTYSLRGDLILGHISELDLED